MRKVDSLWTCPVGSLISIPVPRLELSRWAKIFMESKRAVVRCVLQHLMFSLFHHEDFYPLLIPYADPSISQFFLLPHVNMTFLTECNYPPPCLSHWILFVQTVLNTSPFSGVCNCDNGGGGQPLLSALVSKTGHLLISFRRNPSFQMCSAPLTWKN